MESLKRVLESWDGSNWDEVDELHEENPHQEQASDLVARLRLDWPRDYNPSDKRPDTPESVQCVTPNSSVVEASSSSESPIRLHNTRPEDEFKALFTYNGDIPALSVSKRIEDSICPPLKCRKDCKLCMCGTFSTHDQKKAFWSYRARLTPKEAKAICARFMESIHQGRSHITLALAKHADELMKRWNPGGEFGSEAAREALLKNAAPDLGENLLFMVDGPYGSRVHPDPFNRSTSQRHKLLLPWLNIQLLRTHPTALFALLHHRSHDKLEHWQIFDSSQIRPSFYAGAFDVDWSDTVVILHGNKYGKVTEWDADRVHRAEVVPCPMGFLLLEAQAYLTDVLVKIVVSILDKVDSSQLTGYQTSNRVVSTDFKSKDDAIPWAPFTKVPLCRPSLFDTAESTGNQDWNRAVSTGFRSKDNVITWAPFTNAPLCRPSLFDTADILKTIQAMRQRAEDHLWSLHYDISYLKRQVQLITNSTKWSVLSEGKKAEIFASQMVIMSLNCCDLYCLEQEAWKIHYIRCRYYNQYDNDIIGPGRFLPRDYDMALGVFMRHLYYQVDYRKMRLRSDMCQAPGFRHWSVKPKASSCQDCQLCEQHTPVMYDRQFPSELTLENFGNDSLDWYLTHMAFSHEAYHQNFDISLFPSLFNEYLGQCAEEEKSRFNEDMFHNVCDLDSFTQLWTTVNTHFPQPTVDQREAPIEESMAWRWMTWFRKRWHMPRRRYQEVDLAYMEVGEALFKAFQEYGAHKTGPSDQTELETQRRLGYAVVNFWKSIEKQVENEINGPILTQDERHELINLVCFDQLVDHSRAPHAKEDVISVQIGKVGKGQSKATSNRCKNATSAYNKRLASNKASDVKTGIKRIQSIRVSRQVHDGVLCAMFPVTEDEKAQSVDWKDFVAAMEAVGFEARPIATGQDVLFEHEEYGAIAFYKPYPGSVMDPVLCQHYGTRLKRLCHWRRETFVVGKY